MSDDSQAAPPGPLQASTPSQFREAHSDTAFRLVHAELRVTLLPDPHRARYTYVCELETLGPHAATEWIYNIQAEVEEIARPQAWDSDGGLETSLAQADNGTSLFHVRLRNPVPHGRRYAFSYSYETGIRAVVTRGILEQTVTYADWHIFNVECRVLGVAVELPPRAQLIRTVPAAEGHGRGSVRYRDRLRASETVQYMVCYRSRRLGAGFYLWVASAVGSALVGMMLSQLLSTLGK